MGEIQDAIDRIILREAGHLDVAGQQVVVLDDKAGGLVSGLPLSSVAVRLHCDSFVSEQATATCAGRVGLPITVRPLLDAETLRGAGLVLLRLPKSLAALDEIAELAAAVADPRVRLLAGGRDKHMSRGMNEVLARHFDSVSASLGQQRSRVLRASGPRPASGTYPRLRRHEDLGITVCAHGAAFAGTSVDLGTGFLARFLAEMAPDSRDVIDLGCGTGVLATLLARRFPNARVVALDDSSAACRSAEATAAANGVQGRVAVRRADGLHGYDGASADLIVCNPPFHQGTTRDSSTAFTMFGGAGRVLRPGGELWTVYNSHLPYRAALRRGVGPTDIVGQNRWFTVTRSRVPRS